MEYNITAELDATPDGATFERLLNERVIDAFYPALSTSPLGRLEVVLTVQAENLDQATTVGLSLLRATGNEVISIEARTTPDFDRLNGLTPTPELINASEAAEILGISKAAVGQKFTAGELPGQRVGERTIVFARSNIERAKDARK